MIIAIDLGDDRIRRKAVGLPALAQTRAQGLLGSFDHHRDIEHVAQVRPGWRVEQEIIALDNQMIARPAE